MRGVHRAGDLKGYEDIFVKVGEWGKLEHSDLGRNNILDAQDNHIAAPTFVTTFEQMLECKPRLPARLLFDSDESVQVDRAGLSELGTESSFNATTGEQTRDPYKEELLHTGYVTFKFEKLWKAEGGIKRPLKAFFARSIFFDAFRLAPLNRTATALM